VMRTPAEQLLERAQQAGTVRKDLTAMDVMRLMHGIGVAVEQTPGDADRMLSLLLDGVRARPAT
jgi:hypothetical protein